MTRSLGEVRQLAAWTPSLGVVSVYMRFDPADRGGAWRTELRNGLTGMLDGDGGLDHRTLTALRATAERIGERFANHDHDLPRGEAGFVEVAAKAGDERWWSSHVEPIATVPVRCGKCPQVGPLLAMLEQGSARGAALLSAERVRLLEWAPGHVEELHAWELSIFSRAWRERKAAMVADPSRGQAVSASGRDQSDERLEENRNRFLGECGGLAKRVALERRWGELLLFGTADQQRGFGGGFSAPGVTVTAVDAADLVSEPKDRLEPAIQEAVESLDSERQSDLVEQAVEEAQKGARGAVGVEATEAALVEGRVEKLVVDRARADSLEPLVRSALETGAIVATVQPPVAEPLSSSGGVAAMLRY